MRLSLGQGMVLRQEIRLGHPNHIICMLPIFELDLSGLIKFKEYLDGLTPEEIESISTIARKGSGRKSFRDNKLEALVSEFINTGSSEPDVKLKLNEGRLEFEYSTNTPETEFKPGELEFDKCLIRNSKYIKRNVDWVVSSLKQAYEIIINYQKDYLASGDVSKLKSLTQKDVADKMGIHNTTLGRLISGKNIRALDGTLIPLGSLIMQEEDINKLRAYEVIAKMIKDGSYPASDDIARQEVYEETGGENGGILLARRTITKYRNELEKKYKEVRDRLVGKNDIVKVICDEN